MSVIQTSVTQPPAAQAMILAAGRGERMRPLTDHTPKPLLEVQGKPLAQWHLEALAQAGIEQVVINTAWLGDQIPARFGARFQLQTQAESTPLQIHYSREDLDFGGGLETAGGIVRALPQLDRTFWLVAGDAFMPDFRFDEHLRQQFAQSGKLAHLWLVRNPEHNLKGDFGLTPDGLLSNRADAQQTLPFTYSTLALLHQDLFTPEWCPIPAGNPSGIHAALAPILRKAAEAQKVSAEIYTGQWVDVGTPERLAALNQQNLSEHQ